jgi:hypothetical protein
MLLSAVFTDEYIRFLKGGPPVPIEVHCSRPYRLGDVRERHAAAVQVLSLLAYMEAEIRDRGEPSEEEDEELSQ